MELQALRALFRSRAFDTRIPYASEDSSVNAWLNEAEREAAIRKDLIEEVELEAMCQIAVTAGTTLYTLHTKLLRITGLWWLAEDAEEGTLRQPVVLKSREEMDRLYPTWRESTGAPCRAMFRDKQLRLGSIPDTDGTLYLEATRLPLEDMAEDDDAPEIAEAHHEPLVEWALYRHFTQPDGEIQNPKASADALAAFERHFGLKPDADRMRTNEDARPAFVKAYW